MTRADRIGAAATAAVIGLLALAGMRSPDAGAGEVAGTTPAGPAGGVAPRTPAPPAPPAPAGADGPAAKAPHDTYVVTLDPEARAEPARGRVVLYFITDQGRRWRHVAPATGPFWEQPQPIASVEVDDLRPGGRVEIGGGVADAFPGPLDLLEGPVRVQAVLDAGDTERSPLEEPGDVVSDVVSVELSRNAADTVNLTLTRPITGPRPLPTRPNLRWVDFRSQRLSRFYGRDVMHRAGVALPPGYLDEDAATGRKWPTVYVIPGFGGRRAGAVDYADMLLARGIEEIAPMAVYVVLDPESPLGHHGFVDSASNGPRMTALIEELIPHLESEFRLDPRRDARIVTGHSSGGWSALWLQVAAPEVFGACWSSAPDPIDFSAFQMSDLYADENLYVDAAGRPIPSYRRIVSAEGDMEPAMTVAQEGRMELAVHPCGGSGQQWDTWEAMFSPADPSPAHPAPFTGPLPRSMFDARTGAIDKAVVEAWAKFDITRLVAADWKRLGPVVMERVHLSCGALDSFYLDRAVERFGERVQKLADESGGWKGGGYVRIIPDTTHEELPGKIYQDVNEEMRKWLKERD